MTMEDAINTLDQETRRKMAMLVLAGWRFGNYELTGQRTWFYVRHTITGEIMLGDGGHELCTVVANRWHRANMEQL